MLDASYSEKFEKYDLPFQHEIDSIILNTEHKDAVLVCLLINLETVWEKLVKVNTKEYTVVVAWMREWLEDREEWRG